MFAPGTRNRFSRRMKVLYLCLAIAVFLTVVSALASEFSLYSILGFLSCIIVAATFISVNRGLNRENA